MADRVPPPSMHRPRARHGRLLTDEESKIWEAADRGTDDGNAAWCELKAKLRSEEQAQLEAQPPCPSCSSKDAVEPEGALIVFLEQMGDSWHCARCSLSFGGADAADRSRIDAVRCTACGQPSELMWRRESLDRAYWISRCCRAPLASPPPPLR